MIDKYNMTDPADIIQFITGGKAYFTLKSLKTGNRMTYRAFVARDNPNLFFVGAMTGSDNNTSYSYLGVMKPEPLNVRLTAKSKFNEGDVQVMGLNWMLGHLQMDIMPGAIEFWHEGRCGCCGRRLTVPESIKSGIGPECSKRLKKRG